MSKVTLVLGAGIIGVSTAIHLARRGRSVVLVDRRGAGEETSFGNAGLIQREGVVPYGFPQDLSMLIRYGFNNRIDAHYHASAILKLVPFLSRYWWHSNKSRHQVIARAYAPLIENSISEHQDLIQAANADHLIRKDGWVEAFRTNGVRDAEYAEADRLALMARVERLASEAEGRPFEVPDEIAKGAYVLAEPPKGKAKAVIIATGSEVQLALAAQKLLAERKIGVRVVSMPSTSVFDRQDTEYKQSVLPAGLPRVAVEMGSTDGWWKYGCAAVVGIDTYGESAPAPVLFKHFGFTAENVADTVHAALLKR